jgi:chlorophyllase
MLTDTVCRSGRARTPMRRSVANAIVAFFKWMSRDAAAMDGIKARQD